MLTPLSKFHQTYQHPCGGDDAPPAHDLVDGVEEEDAEGEEEERGQRPLVDGVLVLECNSIDIWNFRLELGRNLRQGLRTCLGRRQIG